MAVNFDKLRSLGYASIDDLPPGMLDGLSPDAIAEIARELPTRRPVVPVETPIDYGKGKLPYRAALVRAATQIDRDEGLPPGTALTEVAARMFDQARMGNLAAAREIADRLDGKPSQMVEMDVNISLEQLVLQSYKIEAEQPGQVIDAELITTPELVNN